MENEEKEVVVKEKKKNIFKRIPRTIRKVIVGVLLVIVFAVAIKFSYDTVHRETVLDFGFKNVGMLVTQEWYGRILEDSKEDRKLFEKIHIPFTTSRIIFSLDIEVSAAVDFAKIKPDYSEDGKSVTIKLPHAEVYKPHQVPNTYVSYLDDESWFSRIDGTERHVLEDAMVEKGKNSALKAGLLEKADENAQRLISNMIHAKDKNIEIKWEYID